MKNIILFCCLAVCTLHPLTVKALLLPAPTPLIDVDRIRQVKSPYSLGHYHRLRTNLQVEIGVQTEHTTARKQTTGMYPDVLVRYKLFSAMELQLGAGFHTFSYNGETVSGLGPVSIGTKLLLCDTSGLRPALAFIGSVALPALAHEQFRPSVVAPNLRLAAAHELSRKCELGYNLGVEWQSNNGVATGIYGIGLTFDLTFNTYSNRQMVNKSAMVMQEDTDYDITTTHKMSGFIELSGAASKLSSASYKLSGGLTYGLAEYISVDVSAGTGLTKNAPDYSIGIGLSFRAL